MRVLAAGLVSLAVACGGAADESIDGGDAVLSASGVHVTAPAGWRLVPRAQDAPVVDPRTVLVAGTAGVDPRTSPCQVARYDVPADGAAVVVVRWAPGPAGGDGDTMPPGREPLEQLTRVRTPSFECFLGRGAAAQLFLDGHVYQVNVMVGARSSDAQVADALAVARSFDVDR